MHQQIKESPVNHCTPNEQDGEGFFEAKAILLGRIGRHKNALEIYAYKLHHYLKAEEYCNRVLDLSSPKTSSTSYSPPGLSPTGVSSTAKSSTNTTLSLPLPATLLQPVLQLTSGHSR